MEEIRVKSWADLQDRLYDRSWYQPHGRFRAPFAFRGVANQAFPPRTSLSRLGGRFPTLEDPLLRNFRKYAVASEVPRDSTWNWLAVAQHHGLPTRLLDWTYSPNVALHFATENFDEFGVDGMILAIDFIACRNHLPASLKEILDREGALLFTAEMLNIYAKTLEEFDRNVAREGDHCVAFFEPPSLDERIVNQAALFSFVSNPVVQIDEWLNRQEAGLARRIIIPASLKWEIRDKLDMANITERVIYPGIDGLSRWLRRYYSPNHKIEIGNKIWEIQEMHDGRIVVEREGERREITSRPDGEWWDLTNDQAILVRPRPRQYE
jgi:hypothetical protein